MTSIILTTDQLERWNNTISSLPYSFEYTAQYAKAIELAHGNPVLLFAYENKTGITVIPFSTRQYDNTIDIYSPYGTYGILSSQPSQEWLPIWLEFVTSQRYVCSYLVVNPFFPPHIDSSLSETMAPGNPIYTLDLSLSISALVDNLDENYRREITKLQQSSAQIITDKQQLTPIFLRLYAQFIQSINAKSIYHFSEAALLELIADENAVLIGIKNNETIEAVSLFLYSDWVCNFFLSAALENGRKYSRLILWEAINICKQKNIAYFNLGGGITQEDSLAKFKKRFGSKETRVSNLKQIYDGNLFSNLCEGKELKDNFFPPYY
jgi:hypothetical protein